LLRHEPKIDGLMDRNNDNNCTKLFSSLTTRHSIAGPADSAGPSLSLRMCLPAPTIINRKLASGKISALGEINQAVVVLNTELHRVCDRFSRKRAADSFVSTMSPIRQAPPRRGI
jgi:hypothetical protein